MACILQRPGATYSLECLFKSFARKITDPALVLDDLAVDGDLGGVGQRAGREQRNQQEARAH